LTHHLSNLRKLLLLARSHPNSLEPTFRKEINDESKIFFTLSKWSTSFALWEEWIWLGETSWITMSFYVRLLVVWWRIKTICFLLSTLALNIGFARLFNSSSWFVNWAFYSFWRSWGRSNKLDFCIRSSRLIHFDQWSWNWKHNFLNWINGEKSI